MIEIKIPSIGESISEVTLIKWLKKEGEYVTRDEPIAELESEKASFELNAEQAGQIFLIAKEEDVLQIGDLIAKIDETVAAPAFEPPTTAEINETNETKFAVTDVAVQPEIKETNTKSDDVKSTAEIKATPVAAAMMADKNIEAAKVIASGADGKILKNDVLNVLQSAGRKAFGDTEELFSRNERRQKMSNLRKTISRRLVDAKNTTAMLTTFNEVDMSRILEIRKQYKDEFKKQHNIGLGFMSFFSKACAIALNEIPAVNAYIDLENGELVYHDYADISIAVSTPRGLTVPVMRNVESKSLAEIEKDVAALAAKARDSKLSTEDLQGGTFTITNGGVFGSLISTPIINLPQSAILGMHKIQERPVAVNGQVVIRPMMYIALSYDHRIVDGKESVSFLVRIKELLENPELLLFRKNPIKSLLELE